MLPLAIWLFILGYSIAWTGKMNLGLTYQPQKDGSIKSVDGNGNPAKTYSLMDAITCGSGTTAQNNPAGMGISANQTPTPAPNPVGQPNLSPIANPAPVPNPNPQGFTLPGGIVLPGYFPTPIPNPSPPKPPTIPGGILGGLETLISNTIAGFRLQFKL